MIVNDSQFTQYADVNELLEKILFDVKGILKNTFVGMYLHGSLALGDFDPNRSDIDYLVVTSESLSKEKISELESLHTRILLSELLWKTNFEGSYIDKTALRRYDPTNSIHPVIRSDGSFGLDRHGDEWVIQRYIIREKGIALAGPKPKMLIDPISSNDLRIAQKNTLKHWWAPQLEDSHRLNTSVYQAYAILTMCRALYTMQYGIVATKKDAACWTQEMFQVWSGLIEEAKAWQYGVNLDRIKESQDFIKFTIHKAQSC
ncbi:MULTISPECIES: aminoglycoside adenylyltransferase domain-containing protein [Metabacillus]|uniref:DUF4111 domain-containing protein n=2 Tax=Metabacillus TaxID=2675233 RepID=A0A179SRB7_9BACI|nr:MULTISPECIES: aminoglycoside adenylyltransferase domain-containing protein [Metabacillus]OAS82832.1 hypothetical protein A6K24_11990 [Metabacillus litoralis]QNF30276.1 DUF4111 domain-containing protein [Metabacillus sp. KUDC1714]